MTTTQRQQRAATALAAMKANLINQNRPPSLRISAPLVSAPPPPRTVYAPLRTNPLFKPVLGPSRPWPAGTASAPVVPPAASTVLPTGAHPYNAFATAAANRIWSDYHDPNRVDLATPSDLVWLAQFLVRNPGWVPVPGNYGHGMESYVEPDPAILEQAFR